jgi:hypothetical protein
MVITVKIGEAKKTESRASGSGAGSGATLRIAVPEELEVDLDEYSQIDTSFLKFLHKSWVKVLSPKKILQTNGGFVSKFQDDSVFLRVPAKKEVFQIMFEENTLFYVKSDDENYKSVVEMKVEQSKTEYLAMKKELYLNKKIKEIEVLQKTLEKKLARRI